MHVGTAAINVDDAILVEQCRNGDPMAMERLILKYQDRIYNAILRICANPADAAELTQETFVKVIESIDGFRGRSSFYTWLFRIAMNLTLNRCRRNARVTLRSLDAEEPRSGENAARLLRDFLSDERAVDPETLAQKKEMMQLAVEALKALDDAHRTIVVLRDIEQMSYVEIANVLDIELGTVRSRLSRARSNLRRILEAMLQ